MSGWLKAPFIVSFLLFLCGKFVFNISAVVLPPGKFVLEVFISNQAFVSGAVHSGWWRLAELFLDLVALAMSHHLTLVVLPQWIRFTTSQQMRTRSFSVSTDRTIQLAMD